MKSVHTADHAETPHDAPIRAGVTGWPISHSRSPLIHGTWLKRYGINGTYDRIAVDPDKADDFYAGLMTSGLAGCNVTIPHKERAASHCDRLDATAEILGAVNTLHVEDGQLIGSNTDVVGFLANLDQCQPDWMNALQRCVVLGAGGAARSILYGLKSRGITDIVVLNRHEERARALADRFGAESGPLSAARGALEGAGLLVNTTSLGMEGMPPLEIDLDLMREGSTVADIVYVPYETALLKKARLSRMKTVDGLGMLLHQAVPGFERWFGHRPEVDDALRAVLLDDLGEHEAANNLRHGL